MINRLLMALFVYTLAISTSHGAELDYKLHPEEVAQDIYVFIGSTDHFNRQNGGNIVNTAFIVGDDSVIVIDTGSTLKYGEQMKRAIAKITPKPVSHVILTHHHPDHFLGNQAFDGARIYALPQTIKAIETEGEGLLDNMFYMIGDWAIGTKVVNATHPVNISEMTLAGRSLRLIPLHGHTAGDLAIIDLKTKTLFAGDLAFHDRTPTTPHAFIPDWISALDELAAQNVTTIVPGHGPVERDGSSLKQTADYLKWLQSTLHKAAKNGLEMTEVMQLEKPKEFHNLSVLAEEFERSVFHLWPTLVSRSLPSLAPAH